MLPVELSQLLLTNPFPELRKFGCSVLENIEVVQGVLDMVLKGIL